MLSAHPPCWNWRSEIAQETRCETERYLDFAKHQLVVLSISDMTPHRITWHDISQLTTLPHLTSPHNQPHYFISPRSQPHDITYHITAHYITTTDTPRKHNQPPRKRHHQAEWLKARFGHRTGWSPCAHSIGKFFLCLKVIFPLKPSASGSPAYL